MDIKDFDPNGAGQDNGNYFGLPFTPEHSALVLLSVPWDVTASYGAGAAAGPAAIIGASTQLDLYEPLNPQGWRQGIGTIPIDTKIEQTSSSLRESAVLVMHHLENGGGTDDQSVAGKISEVNEGSLWLNAHVSDQTAHWLDRGKIVGLVGGDHSTPLGLIEALSQRHESFSILHIDAHADLRPGYEGFDFSHASIMYNAVTRVAAVARLTQVGIRDMCDCEADMAASNDRITMFTDYELASAGFRGETWESQCRKIVETLSEKVYVSFDMDGLSPENAPGTGTPVPGGLSFNQAVWLLDLVAAQRHIIGFDVCETAPSANSEWDANVGARILYKLCNLALRSAPADKI